MTCAPSAYDHDKLAMGGSRAEDAVHLATESPNANLGKA
jgi:hypothetical protein